MHFILLDSEELASESAVDASFANARGDDDDDAVAKAKMFNFRRRSAAASDDDEGDAAVRVSDAQLRWLASDLAAATTPAARRLRPWIVVLVRVSRMSRANHFGLSFSHTVSFISHTISFSSQILFLPHCFVPFISQSIHP